MAFFNFFEHAHVRARASALIRFCQDLLLCHRKALTLVPISAQEACTALMKPGAQAPTTTTADWGEATARSGIVGGGEQTGGKGGVEVHNPP